MSFVSYSKRRQFIIIVILSLGIFLHSMIFSLQALLYPAEAESKKATASDYGFIFTVYGICQLIFNPIITSLIRHIDLHSSVCIGIFLNGIASSLFGFVKFIPGRYNFLGLSLILRVVDAFGGLFLYVAAYEYIPTEFPEDLAKNFAILETSFALGISAGPFFGAILYTIGGFTIPFLTFGLASCVYAGIAYIVLPHPSPSHETTTLLKENVEPDKASTESIGYFSMLRVPSIALYALCIACATFNDTYINSVLEPDLRQFKLPTTIVGAVFLSQGLTQGISSVFWGYICDWITRPEMVTLTGVVLLTLEAFLIGPFKFLPISPTLWMTVFSLLLLGVGSGAIFVSAFSQGVAEAGKHGIAVTKSNFFGLYLSAATFGMCLGPIMSGVLMDNFGFRFATSVLTFINLTLAFSIYWILF